MLSETGITRRRFVQAAAASVAGFHIVPRRVLGGPNHVPPSETVLVAIVGCGGQGKRNTQALLGQPDVKVIAVADPRAQADYSQFYYKGVAGRLPVKKLVEEHYGKEAPTFQCADYVDFRRMLDEVKDIDAILCATPDHWHAFVSMAALRRGKHVYCEKPLTHNVYEARVLAEAARKAKLATQMGNQGRSTRYHALACEMIWNGAIGKPKAAYAWTGAAPRDHGRGRPEQAQPVPEGLDWELWLGPKPQRPFNSAYCPYRWRDWWAFGNGALADMMVHNIDPAFAGFDLDKRHPASVECKQTEFVDSEVIAPNNHIVWQYAEEDARPAVTIHWYDGNLPPELPEVEGLRDPGGNGVLILGEQGAMQGGGWSRSVRLIPEEANRAYLQAHKGKTPPRTQPSAPSHHRDWLDAVKGGRPATSDFAYAARLSEMVLLGNVALRAGGRIDWDGPNMQVTNNPEARRYVRETYRQGWDLRKA